MRAGLWDPDFNAFDVQVFPFGRVRTASNVGYNIAIVEGLGEHQLERTLRCGCHVSRDEVDLFRQ